MKHYDSYLQKGLRFIIHQILDNVAVNGLTDDSYYMISFQTPQTKIPDFVRVNYPKEMTIILRNQFHDLQTTDEGFSVTLGFGGVPCNIYVPFSTITTFADPAQQFGLTLTPDSDSPQNSTQEKSADIIDLASLRHKK